MPPRAAALAIFLVLSLPAAGLAKGGPDATGQQAPTNTTAPSISGTPTVGATLSGNDGTWSGNGVKYSEQWMRCDAAGGSCQSSGQGGTSYSVGSADVGSTLRLQVVASNHAASTVAVSGPTAAVTQPPVPSPPVAPVDTTAPSAPSGLTVTAATTTSVSLIWAASTDDVGVAGYEFFVNGRAVSSDVTTSATASGLTCGTSYTLGVASYDSAGNFSSTSTKSASTAACPTAPTSNSQSIYWGGYVEGKQTYNYLFGGTWSNAPWCDPGTQCPLPRFASDSGKSPSVEHWGMCWTCSFDSGIANAVVARGDVPAIDWANDSSASDADIAAGKYDAQVKTVASAMAAFGHPMFLLFDEEMNGTWYPYSPGVNGNTAASFVAMWRHLHDIFVQAGAKNVTWVWVPNVDPSNIFTSFASLYPGDSYVDWTGLNGYNWGSGGGNTWMTFNQVFAPSYKALLSLAPTKPVMIGEVASEETGGNKAAWITDMLTTQLPQNFPQIKAVLWFNWRVYEKSQYWNWEVESSSSAQSAFKQGIAASYYAAGGGFGALPLLTKIQPLQ
jgi:Glycosyl hydrolase family 26/Fibronectin type III domain